MKLLTKNRYSKISVILLNIIIVMMMFQPYQTPDMVVFSPAIVPTSAYYKSTTDLYDDETSLYRTGYTYWNNEGIEGGYSTWSASAHEGLFANSYVRWTFETDPVTSGFTTKTYTTAVALYLVGSLYSTNVHLNIKFKLRKWSDSSQVGNTQEQEWTSGSFNGVNYMYLQESLDASTDYYYEITIELYARNGWPVAYADFYSYSTDYIQFRVFAIYD
ncbi:MAG: hypothetical protein ACTSP4_10245 [Candidatus Hodarchaeales archaeon]